jgi:glycolate oxidase iron-sulfur subunit
MSATENARPDHRGPDPQLIDDCVHCGFCLPTCPTYQLWGEEMDSPRGRIALMKLAEETGEISPPMVEHWDLCLGCMACVTACPSGVKYDLLLLDQRGEVERTHPRTPADRAFRKLIWATLPHPARLRALAPGMPLARKIAPFIARRSPRLGAMLALAPAHPTRRRLPSIVPARGEKRGTVALLQGCVQRVFFGDVNAATVRVLAAEGWEVHIPRAPRCCGSLQLHAGEEDAAKKQAEETIAAFSGYDVVVSNAAGCGSGMKDYGHLVGTPLAEAFSAKVRDVHELLTEHPQRAERRPLARGATRVAYHPACHLHHAQGVRDAPRELLEQIPGVEVVLAADAEVCCGSAGVYNLLEPEPAGELGRRKAAALREVAPDVVAAANPGCAIQIEHHDGPPVVHPIQLLAESIAPSPSAPGLAS